MSNSESKRENLTGVNADEMHSALFAQMVLQHSNMAMLLLGKVPDPQSGRTVRDLEAARLFIDQLEMIEVKTRGNLTREEETLLKQTLMTLRLAFVEAADAPEPASKLSEKPADAPTPAPEAAATEKANTATPTEHQAPAGGEESKKRYSKKFSL